MYQKNIHLLHYMLGTYNLVGRPFCRHAAQDGRPRSHLHRCTWIRLIELYAVVYTNTSGIDRILCCWLRCLYLNDLVICGIACEAKPTAAAAGRTTDMSQCARSNRSRWQPSADTTYPCSNQCLNVYLRNITVVYTYNVTLPSRVRPTLTVNIWNRAIRLKIGKPHHNLTNGERKCYGICLKIYFSM